MLLQDHKVRDRPPPSHPNKKRRRKQPRGDAAEEASDTGEGEAGETEDSDREMAPVAEGGGVGEDAGSAAAEDAGQGRAGAREDAGSDAAPAAEGGEKGGDGAGDDVGGARGGMQTMRRRQRVFFDYSACNQRNV